MRRSIITGLGSYLPRKILTNRDLESMVETNDAWIQERTGICQRHVAETGEYTSHLAEKAAREAMQKAGAAPESIDLVIVATSTPDETMPATAAKVQAKLGIRQGAAFDMQAVCSGFVYALTVADSLLRTGQFRRAVVIGAETYSRILDWKDRNTCVLFGDGAGAVVLEAQEAKEGGAERGILASTLHADGQLHDLIITSGGVSTTGNAGFLTMQGKEVFRHAVTKMADCVTEALGKSGLSINDIDLLVPHQANIRILQGVAKKLGIPEENVLITVGQHANTSAASIPLALCVGEKEGRLKQGKLVVLNALGSGLTWGACVIRW